jgi:2,2-dialkylglycine decarboxylase (pyruvate)
MATLPTTNILHQSDAVIAHCTRLAGLTPHGLTKIALVAGGGEAIEAAIKLAMRVTGRTEVLSLHGAYHGMSLATMGLAGIAPDRSWLPGAVRWPTFRQVPNADAYRNPLGEGPDAWRASLGALENAMDGGYRQVAAFVMEVVQGPGGHVLFPPGYYQAVQRACHARGVLLIVDEIQTGLGRCGANWACDLFGRRPDILVAGKALGGGVPVGALAVRADLVDAEIESEPWNILTFVNQPLAAAAGMAVCGTDLHEYAHGPLYTPASSLPQVMGHEFSAEIAEVGEGVRGLRPGDRVAVLPHVFCATTAFAGGRGSAPTCG